jgi:hypothetical protein
MQTRIIEGKSVFAAHDQMVQSGRRRKRRRRPPRPLLILAAFAARLASHCASSIRLAAGMIVAAWTTLVFIANVPVQAGGEATIKIISKIGVHAFAVELPTNDTERSQGLMFRKELPDGRGMLFDF